MTDPSAEASFPTIVVVQAKACGTKLMTQNRITAKILIFMT
jgi:hypothetical protein